jgi:diketogulonate reductase-like aldo/keto reductase
MEHLTTQGVQVPAIGFGTWRLRDESCRQAVESALDLGYRHIDTADHYDNHADVGAGIAASDVDRGDLFLTSKVAGEDLRYGEIHDVVERGLDDLGVEYIDLLLLHWPSPDVPIEETMQAMNDLRDDGAIRHIGVSQFSVPRLREAIEASDAPILTNQLEYHPYYKQTTFRWEEQRTSIDLHEFCAEHDIFVTAYSPLGVGAVLSNDTVEAIGRRQGKSPAQVVLRWHLQQGVCPIPKASSRAHQRENIDVFDFELTDREMVTISELSGPRTYYWFREFGPVHQLRRTLGSSYSRGRELLPV